MNDQINTSLNLGGYNANLSMSQITGVNGEALISDILLVKEGDNIVVYVNRQGVWFEAIRELSEGAFSHNITAYGLLHLNKPADWLNMDGKSEAQPTVG